MLKTTTPSGKLWVMNDVFEMRAERPEETRLSEAESSVADKLPPLRHISAPEEATQKKKKKKKTLWNSEEAYTAALKSDGRRILLFKAKTLTLISYEKCSKAHHEVISCHGASSLQVWVTRTWRRLWLRFLWVSSSVCWCLWWGPQIQ